MRVALIGDVHANLPALEAVLAHASERGSTAIWNVGDIVGYGAFPDEVVGLLRERDALSIVGNFDLKVLQFKKKKEKWEKKKPRPLYIAFEWTYDNLSKKNRKYLRFLSQELRLKVKGQRILLTHGSPASNEEKITDETPQERLLKLAKIAGADVILCGHSHRPVVREADDARFVNPGSVGRPDDGDPRASYALLEIKAGQVAVRHYRLEYDVERAAAAIRERGLPEIFAQMILQGQSLEALLG
ncbi:MAG: metallophosphoesterase family protein [Anaerolineae bacterium]|nr:metallophosphoesterase family protein [Anaerolineae bacterium]